MASLALGIAGAYVGSFFGPLGASIGWGIGAAIGGRLTAKGQEGPRLTDLRVQTSAFGNPIPIGFGTIRLSGNLIWSTDLVETKHKSSGKGGPKVTTYSYSASFAVALLETSFLQDGALVTNPMVGILRIWADGRLIYGEGTEGNALPLTIYYGTEDQLPDPTIEADKGVGNVPAHRGMAYVVFTDLQLGDYGNRIPQLSFEVVASGEMGLEFYARWPVDYDWPINGSAYSYPYLLNGVENTAAGLVLHRYRSGDHYGAIMGTSDNNVIYYDQRTYALNGSLISGEARTSVTFDGAAAYVHGSMNSGHAYVSWQTSIDCGDGPETFNTFAWLKDGVVTYTPPDLCQVGAMERGLQIGGALIYWNGNVYASTDGAEYPILRRWPAPDGACYTDISDAAFDLSPYTHDPANAADLFLGDDGYLYCRVSYFGGAGPDPEVLGGWGVKLLRLDADLNLVRDWHDTPPAQTIATALGIPGYGSASIYRGHYISHRNAGVVNIGNPCWVLSRMESDETFTFVDEIQLLDPSGEVGPLIYIGGGLSACRGGILRLGSSGIPLSDIVANVSQHVGYANTEYDVAQLTDMVRGYAIGNRMSGRAAIEALQPAYQFGAVESNLTAKFVKWGGEVVATVTADDLGARDDSSDPVDPIRITHLDDAQLPQRIESVFLNLDMDYQEGMQYAQRTASASDVAAAVTLPIVLVDTEAKAMADVLLYNAWLERDRYSWSLPRKWAHLEPTDVINLNGSPVRITGKDEQGYTHINLDGVATRVGVFINGPVAPVPIGFVPQTTTALNRTDLLLLDLPLITDVDFANGYYAAIAGRMEGAWPGAQLFKSIDGGVNYESIYSTVENDTFGVATTALGDWTGGNVFDEVNTVTVRLTPGSGDLASSNELGVLNGANRALLGSEVIQFKTATLGAARTYTLSGLLRGRRGTDRADVIGGHAIGENFVLLPCHNIEGVFAELGQVRLYKGVTSGGLLASATAQSFTNTGIALKPYAPAQLGGGRDGGGDLTLTWVRRTRIGGAWTDNVDTPLSEASEQYVVAIFDDATYVTQVNGWLVTGAQTTTYSAADQTADFGSPQATVYWSVAQIGAYGSGYEAQGAT